MPDRFVLLPSTPTRPLRADRRQRYSRHALRWLEPPIRCRLCRRTESWSMAALSTGCRFDGGGRHGSRVRLTDGARNGFVKVFMWRFLPRAPGQRRLARDWLIAISSVPRDSHRSKGTPTNNTERNGTGYSDNDLAMTGFFTATTRPHLIRRIPIRKGARRTAGCSPTRWGSPTGRCRRCSTRIRQTCWKPTR